MIYIWLKAGLEQICRSQNFAVSDLLYNPICTLIRLLKFGFLPSIEGQFQTLAPWILQQSHFPSKCVSTQPFPGDRIIL